MADLLATAAQDVVVCRGPHLHAPRASPATAEDATPAVVPAALRLAPPRPVALRSVSRKCNNNS